VPSVRLSAMKRRAPTVTPAPLSRSRSTTTVPGPSTSLSASSISCTSSIYMAVGDYVAGGMTHTWAEYKPHEIAGVGAHRARPTSLNVTGAAMLLAWPSWENLA
jgi:hypothetical protein